MPRKESAKGKARADKLPTPIDHIRNCRSDYSAPIGSWAVDEFISIMAEHGLCRASSRFGVEAAPHPLIRQQIMNGIRNAYTAASSVYSFRERRGDKARREKIVNDLDDALAAFVREIKDDISGPFHSSVTEARSIRQAITKYLSSSNPAVGSALSRGATSNFLQITFAREMRYFWMMEVDDEPRKPHKGLLIDLAAAAWVDAKLPDFDISPELLHGRMKKWFAAK